MRVCVRARCRERGGSLWCPVSLSAVLCCGPCSCCASLSVLVRAVAAGRFAVRVRGPWRALWFRDSDMSDVCTNYPIIT